MATKPMTCKDFQEQDAFDRYVLGHMADDELAQFEEHLLLCKRCMYQVEQSDGFASAFLGAMQSEQRREPRREAGYRLDLQLADANGEPIIAHVVDTSRSGMGLRTREKLTPGAILSSPDAQITGTVCYCVDTAGGYRVGLALAS